MSQETGPGEVDRRMMNQTGARGRILLNEPLARYTTWRVGGPADCLYRPEDLTDLAHYLVVLPAGEPLFWLGLGSNLLVRDGGIRGTVVNTRGKLSVQRRLEPDLVYVECGTQCAQVARFCSAEGLTGGEFLAGIPGTMGGALAMNAGAFGGETWNLVRRVHTVNRQGEVRARPAGDYQVGYRTVVAPAGEWFVAAELELKQGEVETGRERIRELLARRAQTQPLNRPSCGSVFRNPPGDYAARLIDVCGLKGCCMGGAVVSEKHANFIINKGDATAADIEMLILHVKKKVLEEHGVELVPEVRIVGEQRSGAVQ